MATYPAYPTAVETIDAARDLAAQARAGFANRPLAAKASYTVVGFGLGQFVGEPADGFGGLDLGLAAPASDLTDQQAADELVAFADAASTAVDSPEGLSGPITGILTTALIRWAAKLAWRLILG